jgi:cell division protein FtsW
MGLCLLFAGMGILAVVTSSFYLSQHQVGEMWFYIVRHCSHVVLALIAGAITYLLPTRFIQSLSPLILLGCIGLLVLVLVPGVGKSVNGAYRWIQVFGINFQVSEAAKLALVLYLASYVQRKQVLLQESIKGAVVPLVVMGVLSILILLEPDFGGAFIILMIGVSMLFFAGLPWRVIALMVIVLGLGMLALAYFTPYRLARLTAFFDPWENPFGDSYQLTQSLMAIGRGGIWGIGYGYGLQKQLYLPEAHTDFIYAVLAEEIGLVGMISIMLCCIALLSRCMYWCYKAIRLDKCYEAMCLYGVVVWWGASMVLSIGVNLGIVPTKGIALPFFSYGGSNLLVNACAVGIILRITKELAQE